VEFDVSDDFDKILAKYFLFIEFSVPIPIFYAISSYPYDPKGEVLPDDAFRNRLAF
jgi:hypothetical protein